MQGFACLLQPNTELLSDNRVLWVISHHASSGTAGSQEHRHISSLSDLGGKLPSLNSDVQGRERGSRKKRGIEEKRVASKKQRDGSLFLYFKETWWKKSKMETEPEVVLDIKPDPGTTSYQV